MKRLDRFRSLYQLLVASISSIISVLVVDYLSAYFPSKSVSTAIMLIIIVSAITIATAVMERLVDNSHWLRRVILRDHFVEGFWCDVSVERTSSRVVQGALLHIYYEDGEIKISGISFDMEGNKIAAFNSTSATYLEKTLYYLYNTQSIYAPSFSETGFGQLAFDHPPTSYTGFFVDFASGTMFRVEGERVSENSLHKFNDFSAIEDKTKFVIEFLSSKNEAFLQHKAGENNNGQAVVGQVQ